MERVKVYGAHGRPQRSGEGVYARALREAFPQLPVEDEGRLHDPALRENFIERVFAYARLCALFRGRWTRGSVVAFHTAHRLQLIAHSPTAYRELGRRVNGVAGVPRRAFRERYAAGFMAALARSATRGRNANVLRYCAGIVERALDAAPRAELAALITDYRRGRTPLCAPIALIRHHARRQRVAELCGQTYLSPHPKELLLRNHGKEADSRVGRRAASASRPARSEAKPSGDRTGGRAKAGPCTVWVWPAAEWR
jgi:uncharacterized protein YbgA (DUF1722 family)